MKAKPIVEWWFDKGFDWPFAVFERLPLGLIRLPCFFILAVVFFVWMALTFPVTLVCMLYDVCTTK